MSMSDMMCVAVVISSNTKASALVTCTDVSTVLQQQQNHVFAVFGRSYVQCGKIVPEKPRNYTTKYAGRGWKRVWGHVHAVGVDVGVVLHRQVEGIKSVSDGQAILSKQFIAVTQLPASLTASLHASPAAATAPYPFGSSEQRCAAQWHRSCTRTASGEVRIFCKCNVQLLQQN